MTAVLGLVLYIVGWTAFNTRFTVASDHFERTQARVGSALVLVGAILIGIGVLIWLI